MKQKAIIAAVIVAVFLIGRFTSPKVTVQDHRKEDSLRNDLRVKGDQLRIAQDSVNHYKIMADTYFNEAEKWRNAKTVIVTKYRNEINSINALPDSALFKQFSAVYPDK